MKAQDRRSWRSSNLQLLTMRRSLFLGVFLVVWMGAIVLRLYDLQIINYVEFLTRAHRQQQRTVEVAPKRGTIYDRNMHPLAMSLAVDSVYAVPSQISDPTMVAGLIAPILGLDPKDVKGEFKAYRSFCWVKRKITREQSQRMRALDLNGIYFEKEMKRFYPDGQLASHVIGYVGMDDNGLGGLEYQMNKEIRGQPGKMVLATDARRQSFHSIERHGKPGENVVLTIDQNLQYIAEKVLADTVEKHHAAGGTVIIQNPHTGEILALANQPTFDPNDYQASPAADRIDRATSWIYEPGSTFKVVTISSAIDDGLAKPTDLIDCQMGAIQIGGRTIHDVREVIRHEMAGPLSVNQVLMYSSDVGSVKIALRMGEERFYRHILKFGFDASTGVNLPNDENGLLMPPRQWSGVSIGEIAIGQGIGVTPLQMADVYSAIANDGVMLRPRIVKDVFRGDVHGATDVSVGRQVVSARTAAMMRQMLEGVVLHGTGIAAQPPGYSAAGKTGTAQKIDANGHYSKKHYVASFIGFAPADHPAVTILVVIDTPVGQIYGAEVAAPAWKTIAEQTLRYLNVPQDQPSNELQIASRSPIRTPRQQREDRVASLPLDSATTGASTRPVEPVSFSEWTGGAHSAVLLNDGPERTVPDFTGLSARRVSEECQALGFGMNMSGSGLAVQQDPAPGTHARVGSSVSVTFSR